MNPNEPTPYLGLRARLSQVWINRWTILLLLVLVRLLIAASGVDSAMGSAKGEAISACQSVESMGSAMVSMPHYLAKGTNELVAKSVEEAIAALKSVLLMTITGIGEVIWFVINMLYSTYACLITMVIRGTVGAGIAIIKEATKFIDKTIGTIGNDIGKTVEKYTKEIDDFMSAINKVGSFFSGGKSEPKKINLTGTIDKLEHLSLPDSVNSTISKLDDIVLPNFKQIQNYTKTVFQTPFREVSKLINNSLGTYHFDRSALPVPAKKQMKLCDDNSGINDFFDAVTSLVSKARKIFLAILILAAILVCGPIAWQEIRRWRTMKERSQLVRTDARDPMDVVYIVSRPHSAGMGLKIGKWFGNGRRQTLVRWAIAYATSMPALFVLALAVAGLFSCLCQYILLHVIKKTVPGLSAEVGEFAEKVVKTLENASMEWATDANKAIIGIDDDLNKNVFGWVNTSTSAVNKTLNFFIYNTSKALNDTFKGTILQDPVYELYECLIGLKAENMQKGLNWISEHAHITLPTLPNDTFSAGASDSLNGTGSDNFLANVGDKTSNKITEVVVKVINKLQDGVRTEAIISTVVLLIWVFIALLGIIRAISLMGGRDKQRGEGGDGHVMDPVPHGGGGDGGIDGGAPQDGGFAEPPHAYLRDPPEDTHVAPQYTAEGTYPARGASVYDDEKFGYAGERNYGNAFQVDSAHNDHDPRRSDYVEYGHKG